MVKRKHQRAYKPHPCCLKTLFDYSTVASWCCEENKVFLQNLVDTFRANLEELGDGWLRQYFGTSLVSDSRKSKEIILLIRALLAETCRNQEDLSAVLQQSWGGSDGSNLFMFKIDANFLCDALWVVDEDEQFGTLKNSALRKIERAFEAPSSLREELQNYEPGKSAASGSASHGSS
jgi:hypothetical protein